MQHHKSKMVTVMILLASLAWNRSAAQDNPDTLITVLKTEVAKIDKDLPKFKVVKIELDDQSTEGAELQKYYDGNVIRKAVLTFYGETGQSISEYYFLSNDLISISETLLKYKTPLFAEKTEIASEELTTLYLKNEILMRWTDNVGKMVDLSQYPERQIRIAEELKMIRDNEKKNF